MSRNSLNTTSITLQVGAGTTAFVAYNVREYDKRDIYDEYSDNDEFETEVDSIIDRIELQISFFLYNLLIIFTVVTKYLESIVISWNIVQIFIETTTKGIPRWKINQ